MERALPPPTVVFHPGRLAVIAALLLPILAVPALLPGYQADRLSLAAVYAVIGLSLNILMGYTGQISLGHQAFVGVGAFAAAYLTTARGIPFVASVPLAGLIGALTAALMGLVALRIRGLYLALVTLAYGAVAERSIFSIRELTGGGAGMPAPRPAVVRSDSAFAYVCLAVLAVLLVVDWRMLRTKFGRALLALKSDERVAASFGIDPALYRVGAFTLSGAFAGIGGGLLAFKNEHVVAQDFTFAAALTFVLMVILGGLGSRVGVVIGSALIAELPFLLDSVAGATGVAELIVLKIAISGALLLAVVTVFPGGIAQQLRPVTRWLSGGSLRREE
ncbi:MAG: branched-chain amino acid ABC transporter permease [Actinomycetota bacterium]